MREVVFFWSVHTEQNILSNEGSYLAQGYVSCQSSCHRRDTRFRFECDGLPKSTSELDDVSGLGDDDEREAGEEEREWVVERASERERRKLGLGEVNSDWELDGAVIVSTLV